MFSPIYIATSAPTVNDDRDSGFIKGTYWWDETGMRMYLCTDDADGAANWDNVSSGSISSWDDWTPSYTWTGGTPSGLSTVARYLLMGNLCFITLQVTGTTSLGGLTDMSATLPATAAVVDNNSLIPMETYLIEAGTPSRLLMASINSVTDPARLNCENFKSLPGSTAFGLYFSGSYETE